ncbi:MAG TPA: hypothetical protein VN451_05375 [Chitinophagaceae bacterium]|nr:hypothetical protein [Chitinophagaceae bacterium]
MLIFYGKMKTLIGSYEAFMYECPYCEKTNTTFLSVYSWYYHIFWIPLFPYLKEACALCSACKANRGENKFGPKLVSEFKENKKRFHHPWWTWMWTIIFFAVIVSIIIVAPK